MTKKHFEAMAEHIRGLGEPDDKREAAFIMGAVSLAINTGLKFNPNFDAHRFREACGQPYKSARMILG